MPWITLPLTATLLATVGILGAMAILLIWLSFGPRIGRLIQTFRGVAPPFFGSVTVILAILIGFLANDIRDRDQRAATSVRSEADSLVTLFTLVSTSGIAVADPVAQAIRTYATAVTKKEWAAMAMGEHLEKIRPQIAAMTIYTMSLIFVIGLPAAHEVPFVPQTVISSDPIAHVLDLVPGQTMEVGGRAP